MFFFAYRPKGQETSACVFHKILLRWVVAQMDFRGTIWQRSCCVFDLDWATTWLVKLKHWFVSTALRTRPLKISNCVVGMVGWIALHVAAESCCRKVLLLVKPDRTFLVDRDSRLRGNVVQKKASLALKNKNCIYTLRPFNLVMSLPLITYKTRQIRVKKIEQKLCTKGMYVLIDIIITREKPM